MPFSDDVTMHNARPCRCDPGAATGSGSWGAGVRLCAPGLHTLLLGCDPMVTFGRGSCSVRTTSNSKLRTVPMVGDVNRMFSACGDTGTSERARAAGPRTPVRTMSGGPRPASS